MRRDLRIECKDKRFIKIVISMILIFLYASLLLSQEKTSQIIPDGSHIYKEMKPTSSNSRYFSIKFGLSYFVPSEQSFKKTYKGGLAVGGEINLKLWKFIDLWLTGNYYSKKANLIFTKEETTMTLIPIGIGGKIRFQRGKINPYLGIGPVVFIYKEENPIGVAEGTGLGIISQAGCFLKIKGGLLFDVFLNYSYCAVTPQKIRANLGGIQVGLGLGYKF